MQINPTLYPVETREQFDARIIGNMKREIEECKDDVRRDAIAKTLQQYMNACRLAVFLIETGSI